MACSKLLLLLLALLLNICLAACGDATPSSSSASNSAKSSTSPVFTNSNTPVATTFAGDPTPNFYYYIAETADSGDTWTFLMNLEERSGKKSSNAVTLNCVGLKTCFNLDNFTDSTSTKYFQIAGEGTQRWKYFAEPDGGDTFCISRTECWRLFNNGSTGVVSYSKDSGATWTALTRTGSLRVSEANQPLYLNSRRDDKIETEFAFIHALTCVNSSHCLTAGQGRSIRTIDGGQTWDWFPTDGKWYFVGLVCFDEMTCYGFGRDFIAVTHNFGESWQPFNLPVTGPYLNFTGESCPDISFCVVAGNQGYFLTTNDKGTTWVKRPLPGSISMSDVSCPDANTCYATISDQSLLITHDRGQTWSSKPVTLENFDGYSRISCPSPANCLINYKKLDYK